MLKKIYKHFMIKLIILILILIPCITHGQTVIEIPYTIEYYDGDDINNVDMLIDEFKQIMSIEKQNRTVEEWDRSIEIIFTIYYNADVTLLLEQLNNDIDKYETLIDDLNDYISIFEGIYLTEKENIDKYKQIQENFNKIHDNYSILYQNFEKLQENNNISNKNINYNLFFIGGYTINTSITTGLGFSVNFNYLLIGGKYEVNFQDTLRHNVSLLLGVHF